MIASSTRNASVWPCPPAGQGHPRPDDAGTVREDPLATALERLADGKALDWAETARTTGRVAHLLWQRSGRLTGLSPQDQAAVHHTLALGHRIQSVPPDRSGLSFWWRKAGEFQTDAAYATALCDPTAHVSSGSVTCRARQAREAATSWRRLCALPPDRQAEVLQRLVPVPRYRWMTNVDDTSPSLARALDHAEEAPPASPPPSPSSNERLPVPGHGTDLVRRLSRLPQGWQIEAVRRIAAGVSPLEAVSDPALSINLVRVLGHHSFRTYWAGEAASHPCTSPPERTCIGWSHRATVTSPEVLRDALTTGVFPSRFPDRPETRQPPGPQQRGGPRPLTPAQLCVGELLLVGGTDRETADELGVSLATVREHLANISNRAGGRTAAARAAALLAGGHLPAPSAGMLAARAFTALDLAVLPVLAEISPETTTPQELRAHHARKEYAAGLHQQTSARTDATS